MVTLTSIQICVKEGCWYFFHKVDFYTKFIYLIPWIVSHISLGLGQHQMKLAGHNHALFLLSVMNFKIADASKKNYIYIYIYLKSTAKSARLNIIIKNANSILTYLRLIWKKRFDYSWVYSILPGTFSRVKVQSNRSANSKACLYRNTFLHKEDWLVELFELSGIT